uniref:SXP/RAL-2 family protein Ani s 5-like cation-binding domain-containing protein n=1 Tax=Strongyloides stercoralis TaxID=6248 RepID=A0A0K0ET54_STRER
MVLTEEKNNVQATEDGLKANEGKRNKNFPESVNQMLKLRSNLNSVVSQRFKDKVNDDQIKEVSEKIEELSSFFEKLLQDSGYEKRPYRGRRYKGYRPRFYNNRKHHGNSGNEHDGEKPKNTTDEHNKENDASQKKSNRKKNFGRNNYRRYNKKNMNSKANDGTNTEDSPENSKEENEASSVKKE